MPAISIMIQELLLAIISKNVLMPRKSRMDWALMALSILFAGAGVLSLVIALERYLEGRYEPYQAALASGALVLLLALLAGIGARQISHRKSASVGSAQTELIKNIQTLVEDLCGELADPVRENPKAAVLIASIAGFFVASQRLKP